MYEALAVDKHRPGALVCDPLRLEPDKREDAPLTLIAAMDCGSYLLLGADSGVSADRVVTRSPVPKLDFVAQAPMAWGFFGDETIGRAFSSWLRGELLGLMENWESLTESAAGRLADLNGERREALKRSGVHEKAGDTADVVLGGFVGGEREIVHLDKRGAVHPSKHYETLFYGSGDSLAGEMWGIIRATVRNFPPAAQPDESKLLQHVMAQTIEAPRSLHLLKGPVRMLKITPEGVFDISDKAFKAVYDVDAAG
jgi:hypothetical protein